MRAWLQARASLEATTKRHATEAAKFAGVDVDMVKQGYIAAKVRSFTRTLIEPASLCCEKIMTARPAICMPTLTQSHITARLSIRPSVIPQAAYETIANATKLQTANYEKLRQEKTHRQRAYKHNRKACEQVRLCVDVSLLGDRVGACAVQSSAVR